MADAATRTLETVGKLRAAEDPWVSSGRVGTHTTAQLDSFSLRMRRRGEGISRTRLLAFLALLLRIALHHELDTVAYQSAHPR